MPGKKEVASEYEFIYNHRIDVELAGERSYVRQVYKKRPDKNKERYAAEYERYPFRLGKAQVRDKDPKKDGAVNKSNVHVVYAGIA